MPSWFDTPPGHRSFSTCAGLAWQHAPPLSCRKLRCIFQHRHSFLDAGAQLSAVNGHTDTVLHTAAGFGNLHALQNLPGELAEPGRQEALRLLSAKNKAGKTPLQLAILAGWSVASVSFLSSLTTNSIDPFQLIVTSGWRQEIADHLALQMLQSPDGILWQNLNLLWLSCKPDSIANSGSRHWPVPKPQVAANAGNANNMLREHLVAKLVRLAALRDTGMTGLTLMQSVKKQEMLHLNVFHIKC